MRALTITVGALALTTMFAAPAMAQQAGDKVAAPHADGGGQCAISQAMLAAVEDNKQRHVDATKLQIDRLIEDALASSHAAKSGGSPVIMGNRPAGG